MTKKYIDVKEYAGDIYNAVSKGVLLTTKNGENVNTMTISWGSFGIEWGVPIFTTYVRESRFTLGQIDGSGEFTVNMPYGKNAVKVPAICGIKSGRDTDKIKEAGLTLVDGDKVGAPAIKEYPLTLECKVVYRQLQDKNEYREKFMDYYPQDENGGIDTHVAFFGEVVAAYIIED